jgi:ABC-type multidrug transport system ATPase subunit
LNALCGRAYYGEVLGEIYINGQQTDIREIADSVGFVPQDDIVYAELTVRENLIYTGKFLLPRGTNLQEIEELADDTLSSLGLSRVANSLVGDVKRRGVSGGEKKRVNIGLELMKRPAVLFLDEPTSGLVRNVFCDVLVWGDVVLSTSCMSGISLIFFPSFVLHPRSPFFRMPVRLYW